MHLGALHPEIRVCILVHYLGALHLKICLCVCVCVCVCYLDCISILLAITVVNATKIVLLLAEALPEKWTCLTLSLRCKLLDPDCLHNGDSSIVVSSWHHV